MPQRSLVKSTAFKYRNAHQKQFLQKVVWSQQGRTYRLRQLCTSTYIPTQVYRAFEPDLNDSIAIRRVKKSQADMEDIRKEKQINDELRKVENENILKIYDIIDLPEAVWYIT